MGIDRLLRLTVCMPPTPMNPMKATNGHGHRWHEKQHKFDDSHDVPGKATVWKAGPEIDMVLGMSTATAIAPTVVQEDLHHIAVLQ